MFTDLDDFDNAPVKETARTETFPCVKCAGTGVYQNVRIRQSKAHCFACNGRGFFKTSPQHREKSRQAAAKRRAKALDEKARQIAEWRTEHAELVRFLRDCAWSDFAQSLWAAVNDYGKLSERQLTAAYKMKANCERKQQERAAAKTAEAAAKPTIDLTRIKELFDTAQINGLKKPKLRISDLVLSLAPAHGRNAGAIYVKTNDDYAGKITTEGKFFGVTENRAAIETELLELAKDPLKQATAYGHRTGNCACCGRELTAKDSVERGIGPVCAGKWGI